MHEEWSKSVSPYLLSEVAVVLNSVIWLLRNTLAK